MVVLNLAPQNFPIDRIGTAVFVNFISATYNLDFEVDPSNDRLVRSQASFTIGFEVAEPGFPVFDFAAEKTEVLLNGRSAKLIRHPFPEGSSNCSYVDKPVREGRHLLTGTYDINDVSIFWKPAEAIDGGLVCFFAMDDLGGDAHFSGGYLPSNFEYDHYPSSISITIDGSNKQHQVISNGAVKPVGQNKFSIDFPSYFTTSFPYLHIVPTEQFTFLPGSYDSIDLSRQIRLNAYAPAGSAAAGALGQFVSDARDHLRALEKDFGPFPYDSMQICALGLEDRGGMEYAGATATYLPSLRHELDHCYFARCVAPCRGDSGWIDEAIAYWGDEGYPASAGLPTTGSEMGNRSQYGRATSSLASTTGKNLLAHFHHKFRDKGGLKPALSTYFEQRKFKSTSNVIFKQTLENVLGESLDAEFDEFVYGGERPVMRTFGRQVRALMRRCNPFLSEPSSPCENPHVQDMSDLRSRLIPTR